MHNANFSKLNAVFLYAVVSLAACGGGGSEAPPAEPAIDDPESAPLLTPLQTEFQASVDAAAGGSHVLFSSLPATGIPSPGAHYAFATQQTLSSRASETPQSLSVTVAPISASLPLPNFAAWTPLRVLLDGRIAVEASLPNDTKLRARLIDSGVVVETMAADGVAIASAARVTAVEALPLSGGFAAAPAEVRNWTPLAPLSSNASLLKPNPTFLPGAGYFKRTSVRHGDTVFVRDCNGPTLTANVTPCAGATSLDSGAFPHSFGGVSYLKAAGTIQTLAGVRAWVSTIPMSSSDSATEAQLVLFELDGAVYRGLLERDGVAIRTRNAQGVLVDYSLRFNKAAIDSLKAAVAG